MRTEFFKSRIFFYIFLAIVTLDFVNGLLLVSKPTEIAGILVLKWLKLLISFSTFLMFFLKTNYNHQIFKIFIYFVGILMPLYILLYHIKELVFYGIHPISAEKLIENGFNLFFAIILLIFYNKYKIDNNVQPNP